MVSSAGISLMNSYGSGVRHYQHMHHGNGIARRAISGLVGLAGRALLNKLTGAIAGTGRRRTYRRSVTAGSYKPTGTGMHHRRTYRKRIGTTRTHAIGGYRRKVHRVGCGEGYRKINHIGYGEGYKKGYIAHMFDVMLVVMAVVVKPFVLAQHAANILF